MLTRIHLQNFAISTAAEVELEDGMTVLTGETGAGKSILVDALNLVLGDRADTSVVRHGSERATIHASFQLADNSPALNWLKEQELDDGSECQLRRVISGEGRSKAYINNTPTNLSSLKTLGEMLIDIHGQHEHQALMIPARQRQVLDNTGGYATLLSCISSTAKEIKSIRGQLDALQQSQSDQQAQLELLSYQLQELETAGVAELDIPELLKHHEEMSHAETLQQLCAQTLHALKDGEDEAISNQLGKLIHQLENWQKTSEEIASTHQLLMDTVALIEEASRQLSPLHERLDIDPAELQSIERQVTTLHELARKHQVKVESLPELHQDKATALQNIDQAVADLSDLTSQLDSLQTQYHEQAEQLHQQRLKHAEKLSTQVTEQMQQLGMEGGHFKVQVESKTGEPVFSEHGNDDIRFMVSANPGQPPQALQKVASGGELSRISLAITVISANQQSTPTMIFDEVDSGIGGAVADTVGKQLHQLGESLQVLCVTHLPQVAACGHHHFRVVKTSTDDHTESRVLPLDEESRIQEIARMLGGANITEKSLAHARELLAAGSESEALAS